MSIETALAELKTAIAESDRAGLELKAGWYRRSHTVKELRKLASEAGIAGRSKMNKEELCMALAQAWDCGAEEEEDFSSVNDVSHEEALSQEMAVAEGLEEAPELPDWMKEAIAAAADALDAVEEVEAEEIPDWEKEAIAAKADFAAEEAMWQELAEFNAEPLSMAYEEAPSAEEAAEVPVVSYHATVEHQASEVVEVSEAVELAQLALTVWLVAEVIISLAVGLGSILGAVAAWAVRVYRANRKVMECKPQSQRAGYAQRLAWSYGF